jgi:hypothetical protein
VGVGVAVAVAATLIKTRMIMKSHRVGRKILMTYILKAQHILKHHQRRPNQQQQQNKLKATALPHKVATTSTKAKQKQAPRKSSGEDLCTLCQYGCNDKDLVCTSCNNVTHKM